LAILDVWLRLQVSHPVIVNETGREVHVRRNHYSQS